jgi:perosamine synthetase
MIPLVAPTITGHDRGYIRQRLGNGLLDSEAEVRRFEEAFAEYVGCAGAVAVCSGTIALELALHVLDISVVGIPTYSCVALRNATRRNAVTYLDSEFDVQNARMALEPCSGSLVVTHMFGMITTFTLNLLEHFRLIEDWTLSLGAAPCPVGDIGVCSTHESKMLSTGRGGMVFSNDDVVLEDVRALVNARSVGMSATQAALGISQLQQLDSFIERRRTLAYFYSDQFAAAGIACPDPECGSVFFRYLIAVDDPADAVACLAEDGIEAGRGVYPPLHRLAGLPDDRFPGATWCVNHLLSVPCHPSITDEQAAYIAEQVIQVCAK